MDKLTYLAELAEGLARWVPERERQDILRYYAEYFEEAGPEREAQVVQELGDPWALSCRLAVEGGYVTADQAAAWSPPKKKKWPWVLVGVAAVVFLIGSAAASVARFGLNLAQMVSGRVVQDAVAEAVPVPSVAVDYGVTYIEGGDFWGDSFGAALEGFEVIDADISLGNITVVVGDEYMLGVDQSADIGGYNLKWEIKNGTLKIRDGSAVNHVEVNNWDDFKAMFGMGQYSIDILITVPDSDMLLEKVSVKTGLGNIMLYDVSAEKVTAETGMGNVECYNCRQVKKLDLDTGMGNVMLGLEEPYSGVDIDLESGMGNVEASLGGSEQDWEYEAESGLGNVTINGYGQGSKAERKGNMPYKLDAESGMGDVNVYFEDD